MSIWVVTREVNWYNQDGAYFVAAYKSKPTLEKLRKLLPEECDDLLLKLLDGGGREEYEDEWYNLDEFQSGELFDC